MIAGSAATMMKNVEQPLTKMNFRVSFINMMTIGTKETQSRGILMPSPENRQITLEEEEDGQSRTAKVPIKLKAS